MSALDNAIDVLSFMSLLIAGTLALSINEWVLPIFAPFLITTMYKWWSKERDNSPLNCNQRPDKSVASVISWGRFLLMLASLIAVNVGQHSIVVPPTFVVSVLVILVGGGVLYEVFEDCTYEGRTTGNKTGKTFHKLPLAISGALLAVWLGVSYSNTLNATPPPQPPHEFAYGISWMWVAAFTVWSAVHVYTFNHLSWFYLFSLVAPIAVSLIIEQPTPITGTWFTAYIYSSFLVEHVLAQMPGPMREDKDPDDRYVVGFGTFSAIWTFVWLMVNLVGHL